MCFGFKETLENLDEFNSNLFMLSISYDKFVSWVTMNNNTIMTKVLVATQLTHWKRSGSIYHQITTEMTQCCHLMHENGMAQDLTMPFKDVPTSTNYLPRRKQKGLASTIHTDKSYDLFTCWDIFVSKSSSEKHAKISRSAMRQVRAFNQIVMW